MNAVFHLLSLAFLIALVVLLLRAQRDREVVLSLLLGQRRFLQEQRVEVALPSAYLRRLALVLGIRFEGRGPRSERPARMMPFLFTELFLQSGLSLIRCSQSSSDASARLLVELQTVVPISDHRWVERLQQALGGQVDVCFLPPGGLPSPSSLH